MISNLCDFILNLDIHLLLELKLLYQVFIDFNLDNFGHWSFFLYQHNIKVSLFYSRHSFKCQFIFLFSFDQKVGVK